MTWRRVWIWERDLSGGTTYYIRWYDERGQMRSEAIGPDRRLAERRRSEKEVELNKPGTEEEPEDIFFQDFKQEELEIMQGRLAEGSLVDLEHTLRDFGEHSQVEMLEDITPRMIEKYLAHRLGNVSRATANKNLRTLSASLNRAVERGYLAENPAEDIDQVREPERDIRVLSAEEVEKLLGACHSTRWRALVTLAVTTGMRLGEMQALRWEDVDLEKGAVEVKNTPDHRTKSGKNRTLPLPEETVQVLDRLDRNGPYVFHTSTGRPWNNNLQRGFRRIVEKAGVEYCSIHDLRRTFISHLAMEGASAAVVKKLAGHASIRTTQKYYTRIMPDAVKSAADRLPFGDAIRRATMCTESAHAGTEDSTDEKGKVINLAQFVG